VPATAPDAGAQLKKLRELRPGHWLELQGTNMSAVFPTREQTTWGVVGPASVIIAWGGAAFDTKRNAFVFNGGGHGDYGGNEVYAFMLDEMRWQRLTDPSPMRELERGKYETTDDTPISTHTYDGLEYLPNVDRVFRNGGAEWQRGTNYDRSVWLFDVGRRRWERKSVGSGGQLGTAYDPVRGTVYVVGRSYVDEYDPVRDTWTRRVRTPDGSSHIIAIDPENRRLFNKSSSRQGGIIVHEIGPDGSVSARILGKTTGATEWDAKLLGLEYDPVRKVLVAWEGARETAYLDGKTLAWRRHANTESAAGPVRSKERREGDYRASGAIYGRWRYVPKYDVFIGYNNPGGNVWVWKPAAASAGDTSPPPPPPEPVIKPLLDKLTDGQTVVLPPGVYKEAGRIAASNVVIKAHGVRLEETAHEHKGALVVAGNNVTIEGLECAGIRVRDNNGSCVRLEAKDLTLRKVWFRDSQSGLMTWNKDSGTVLIEDSKFERIGRAHGVYIGRGPTHLILRNSSFLSSTAEGHEVKSRAARNTIERCTIASLDGKDSRLIDLPEGGVNVIRGNVLQKGPASSNQDLIGIGMEARRALHETNSSVIEDNVFILERPEANVPLHERDVPPARMERNTFIGGERPAGNNKWFPNRAAAGLGAYPALPRPR
jgi:hypothetical protein